MLKALRLLRIVLYPGYCIMPLCSLRLYTLELLAVTSRIARAYVCTADISMLGIHFSAILNSCSIFSQKGKEKLSQARKGPKSINCTLHCFLVYTVTGRLKVGFCGFHCYATTSQSARCIRCDRCYSTNTQHFLAVKRFLSNQIVAAENTTVRKGVFYSRRKHYV
jgi:hypothetical protein